MSEHTKWSWLDIGQRDEFRYKWEQVRKMVTKWDDTPLGTSIPLFSNHKDLEKEIDDLEDLSLAAYRAMKLLKKQLREGSKSDTAFNDALGRSLREQKALHVCHNCKKVITDDPVCVTKDVDGHTRKNYYCNLKCLSQYENPI